MEQQVIESEKQKELFQIIFKSSISFSDKACKLTETLWNMFRTTTGVAVIPTVGGIPVSVTEDEINRIKEIQKAEGFSNEELKCLRKKENEKYSILRKEK